MRISPEILKSATWKPVPDTLSNPLISILIKFKKAGKPFGWRRLQMHQMVHEMKFGGAFTKQFDDKESTLFHTEHCMLMGIRHYGIMQDFCHAWGRSRNYPLQHFKHFMERVGPQRATRSDKGISMIEDVDFAKRKITPFSIFKQQRGNLLYGDYSAAETSKRTKILRDIWESMDPDMQMPFAAAAKERHIRAPHIWDDIKEELKKSDGCVSWRDLALSIGDWCCANTISSYVTKIEDFSYVSSRLVPYISEATRIRRKLWAHAFLVFWEYAKRLNLRVLLCHMDEKWFYACVCRRNGKSILSIGVSPKTYKVQHKNSIEKIMCVAVSGFVFHNSDITTGGQPVKISFSRCGKMMPAKRNSYKRVYRADGTWKNDGIQLRRKGELYWKAMEVTGSDTGTEKQPKFDLLSLHRDVIFPSMELEARKHGCIIRYQIDGAGAHQDRTFRNYVHQEFLKRGWMFNMQPPQSPASNTKDYLIFPLMSKSMDKYRTNKLFKWDEIWNAARRSWDIMHLSTISRAYAAHHQVVFSMFESDGSNEYLHGKGAMHFGIRRNYVCTSEGVIVLKQSVTGNDPSLKHKMPSLPVDYNSLDVLEKSAVVQATSIHSYCTC